MPKRILKGIAVRDSIDNTVTVNVERQKKHERLKKIIKKQKKYLAHDPDNSVKAGDMVSIEEHVPFSKRKKWLILK